MLRFPAFASIDGCATLCDNCLLAAIEAVLYPAYGMEADFQVVLVLQIRNAFRYQEAEVLGGGSIDIVCVSCARADLLTLVAYTARLSEIL